MGMCYRKPARRLGTAQESVQAYAQWQPLDRHVVMDKTGCWCLSDVCLGTIPVCTPFVDLPVGLSYLETCCSVTAASHVFTSSGMLLSEHSPDFTSVLCLPGDLPTDWAQMTSLSTLSIRDNSLNGTLISMHRFALLHAVLRAT